jgi:hypothetical protein
MLFTGHNENIPGQVDQAKRWADGNVAIIGLPCHGFCLRRRSRGRPQLTVGAAA